MCDGHRRTGAMLELQDRRRRVFDLPLEHDVRGTAGDVFHAPEQMEQHLEAMTAEIHHRAATRLRGFHEPVARVVGRWIEALESVDVCHDRTTDLARRKDFPGP